MVVVWTAVSYATENHVPAGIPRRLHSPLAWSDKATKSCTVVKVVIHYKGRSINQQIEQNVTHITVGRIWERYPLLIYSQPLSLL